MTYPLPRLCGSGPTNYSTQTQAIPINNQIPSAHHTGGFKWGPLFPFLCKMMAISPMLWHTNHMLSSVTLLKRIQPTVMSEELVEYSLVQLLSKRLLRLAELLWISKSVYNLQQLNTTEFTYGCTISQVTDPLPTVSFCQDRLKAAHIIWRCDQ